MNGSTLGDDEKMGRIWVEGHWTWGAVLAWHVADVPVATGGVVYYWNLNLWKWNRHKNEFECQHLHTMEANPNYVEDWMVRKSMPKPPGGYNVGLLMANVVRAQLGRGSPPSDDGL